MSISNYFTRINRLVISLALISLVFVLQQRIFAIPINNYQDPVPFHTVMGSDKYYTPVEKAAFSLHLSPFYQHTHASSNPDGTKTSDGNVIGQWNMAGIFLNDANVRTPQAITALNSPSYQNAKRALTTFDGNLVNDNVFNQTLTAYQIPIFNDVSLRYEKTGLRAQMNFDLGVGLGMNIKAGIVDMKNRPDYFAINQNLAVGLSLISPPTNGAPNAQPAPYTAPKDAQALAMYNQLLSATGVNNILGTIGFDTNDFELTDLEDLHANVYWHVPIKIREKEEVAFRIIPYLSVGTSLPMGKDRNFNKLFAVVNGNDGFTGLTAEGALALDFPDMMQLSFGGGVTTYMSRDLKGYHVPNSFNQSGIYPWTTDISKKPGNLWYANISMKAENIMSKKDVPNFSVYFDYLFTQHRADSITLKDNSLTAFRPFIPMLQRDSSWKAQVLHGGVKCALSKNVFLAFSVQKSLPGARTYRPTTLLGGLVMNF